MQQTLSVGVAGIGKQVLCRGAFYKSACVHDPHCVCHLGCNAQVMGDQQHGHAALAAAGCKQTQYLALNGRIQRSGGLIGQQQPRFARKSHGNHDTLAHATRELVANENSKGMAQVMLEYEIPVAFGVLTTDNVEQAIQRAGTKAGNKGAEAALSALEMINVLKNLGA